MPVASLQDINLTTLSEDIVQAIHSKNIPLPLLIEIWSMVPQFKPPIDIMKLHLSEITWDKEIINNSSILNVFSRLGIYTVEDLFNIGWHKIISVRGIGKGKLSSIKKVFSRLTGLELPKRPIDYSLPRQSR